MPAPARPRSAPRQLPPQSVKSAPNCARSFLCSQSTNPARLVRAYRRGIFPFFDETTPILWWSPDPRGVFELDGLHVSRRLARTLLDGHAKDEPPSQIDHAQQHDEQDG